jgi:hypothetical protein
MRIYPALIGSGLRPPVPGPEIPPVIMKKGIFSDYTIAIGRINMQNLNGCKPNLSELCRALGAEYKEVLSEYLNNDNVLAGAA